MQEIWLKYFQELLRLKYSNSFSSTLSCLVRLPLNILGVRDPLMGFCLSECIPMFHVLGTRSAVKFDLRSKYPPPAFHCSLRLVSKPAAPRGWEAPGTPPPYYSQTKVIETGVWWPYTAGIWPSVQPSVPPG